MNGCQNAHSVLKLQKVSGFRFQKCQQIQRFPTVSPQPKSYSPKLAYIKSLLCLRVIQIECGTSSEHQVQLLNLLSYRFDLIEKNQLSLLAVSSLRNEQMISSFNSYFYLLKYINIILMKFLIKGILLLLILISTYSQTPTATCPLLCANNCTSGTICTSCYVTFTSASATNSSCTCPQSMFLDSSTLWCRPCPIYCLSCSSSSVCTSCVTGFILRNNYSCILNSTNSNGWVSKNVTYQLTSPDYTGVSNLVIVNGTVLNLTNNLASIAGLLSTCTKLGSLSWFGGYQSFGYKTKIIKTVFNLPPHQWINIMFQAILIDTWFNNTLLLEINTQQNYNPNTLQNASIIWSATFDSRIRKFDFCGGNTTGDNLVVANSWIAHNASSLKMQIRLNQSESTTDPNQNLNTLYYGIRQLYIRVGTCGRHCQFCSSPNNCTKCASPYVLVSGQCVCDSTLTVGFPTLTGCSPMCVDGEYYNSTASYCLSCSDQYDNCRTCNITTCLTCNPGYLYFTDTLGNAQCLRHCPDNFTATRRYAYNTSIVVNNTLTISLYRDQCVPCPANCLNCNPNNICIFCMPGYIYHKGLCLSSCPGGYYNLDSNCVICSLNCSSCNSTGCTVCADGFRMQNNKCYRACANSTTLLVTESDSCGVVCSSPCLTCGSTDTSCLSCLSGSFLAYSSCFSACPSGMYASGNICTLCPQGCGSCINSTACLTCTTGFYLFNNQCLRSCPPMYYPFINNLTNSNTNEISNVCMACQSGCMRCSDANTCLMCTNDYYFFNFTCSDDEPDQFQHYQSNYRKCSPNCLKCTHRICTRCANNYYLNQGLCVQTCPPQKYPSSTARYDDEDRYVENICVWKNPLCAIYNNTLQDGSCNQCSFTFPAALIRMGWKYEPNFVCTLTCPEFYTKAENLTCIPCPNKCLRCFANMTCLQCTDGYSINNPNLLNSTNQMNQTCLLNVCPQFYFSDSLQCQTCPQNCRICLLDNSCFICDNNYVLDPVSHMCVSNNCSQISQFYNSNISTCEACSSKCRSCFGVANVCTSCPTSSSNQTYLFNGSCILSCPPGYFAHKYSLSCRLCNPRCDSCTNFDSCITCKPNFFILSFYSRQNALCVAECPIGFWTNTTICQRCSPDCKTCYGPSQHQCLSCYPNFYLDEYSCVYSCSPMKYKDNQGHCDWCHPSCQECTGPSKYDCINCIQGQFYYDHRCFNKSCPGATYLSIPSQRICEPCQFGCQYCSSSQFCYFCTPGYKFYKGWCYNQCPGYLAATYSRYYNLLEGQICRSCYYAYSSKCLRCSAKQCKRCPQGHYLYRLGSNYTIFENGVQVIEQCFTSCPNGTYLRRDGGRECINCQAGCFLCVSYSNCTTCSSGYNLVNGYCTQSCPAFTFQLSSGFCMNCPDQCLSCTSLVNCTACKANYSLYTSPTYMTSTCVSTCPTTYYTDQSGWCLRCPSTCVTCSNATFCTTCASGYTFTNGVCVNSSNNTCITNCVSCSGGICRACNGNTLLYINPVNGSAQCVDSCPAGSFAFAGKCLVCNEACATCSNTQDNCTSCVAGLFLYKQNCVPACPSGFFAETTTLICKPCTPNCINCNNRNCTLCASGFFLNQGICNNTCPPATFASLSTLNCFSCNQNCAVCQDIENCTACLPNYSLYNSTCISKCPSSTYVLATQNTQICMPCVSPCFTCTGPNTCLSCIATYILNGTSCQQNCGTGFYLRSYQVYYVQYEDDVDGQDFSTFQQCLPCNVECLTCRDYGSRCITCAVGFVLANGRCLRSCPDGTFNSSSVCMPCSSYCVTCNNINVCAVCVQGTVLYNGLCISNCPQGNYMVLNSTAAVSYYYCAGCSPSCQSCNGSTQYNCLSCNLGYFLWNGMCLQACPQGTYASNLTRRCSPCPVTCTNCTSFSNCGGCIANYTLSNTNQCNPPNWIVCNVSFCVSCSPTNSSQCQQCIPNYYLLSDGTCSLTCPNSTYAQTGQCINCPSICTTCTPTQCTACLTNYYLYNGICYSTCPISTLPSQNTCIPDPCLYYNTTVPFSCLSCTTPYLLAVTNSTSGYLSCVSSCPPGTVQSGSQCITCPVNCVSCQTSSSCLVCNNNTLLANGQCVYHCPVGMYPSNSVCQSCNMSFCLQCNGPNSCSKCSPQSNTYLYNGQCYLNCPTGTYSDFGSGLCINCVSPCLQCISSTACTSCVLNYYLYQSTCQTVCPLGTYNASTATSKICNNCSLGCNNCTSLTNCSFCQSGYLLYFNQGQGSCATSCPSGFYAGFVSSSTFTNSNQYQCLICVSPCITCISETVCVTCLTGYYFYRGSCVSACPSGFYAGSTVSSAGTSQPNCLVCDSSCLTCQNTSTYCTSCPSGYNLDSQGNCNSNCSSPSTYYVLTTRQCLNCSGSCYTCQGPLSTDCLSCRPPLSLYGGQCVTNCPFGYYSTSTYVCKQCSSPCASCSMLSTNCTSCVSPYLTQSSNTGLLCVLNCLTSFYPNSTVQSCYPCSSACLTCSGPASNQCTSCPSGSILLQGSCTTSCPSATVLIQQGSQSICQACSSGCSNCSVSSTSSLSTICTQCLPNYYLYKGICYTSCPSGTYASPTSFTCNLCNLVGCQTCIFNASMSVQCTNCQAGYYPLGDTGTCVTLCPTGYTLVNSQCAVIPVCQGYTYNNLCLMNCPQSTYAVTSPTKTCMNCSASCVSCTNVSVCLQCSNSTYVYYNSSINASSCVSYCSSGLYADSNIGQCSPCGNNCSSCYQSSNQVVCTSCQSGYVLLGSQCVQSCPIGYYQSTSNICQLCSSVCYTCNVSATNCTQCKNINYTAPNCASTTCNSSQFLNLAGTCSNCNAACATCYGANSYQCLTCSNTTYNLDGQCLTACPQGYTPDSNRNCVVCPTNCAVCNTSLCTQCISGYFMVPSTGQCVSSCSALNSNTQTYYINGSYCYACVITNCLVCTAPNGTVQCQICQSNSYSYNSQCLTACPSGTYASTNPNICNKCPTNCTLCTSASVCTACSSGFALVNGACTSTCASGYYLSPNGTITSCFACSAQCLTCSSPTNCTACSQPYTLVSGQCTGCLAGYYFSSSTNTCLICSSSCATCSVQATNCTSCASGYSLLNSSACVSSCPVGYYSLNSVCVSCSTPNCAICASNVCSGCESGYVQTVVSGVITCSSNCSVSTFLNTVTNTCINCSSNCLSCSSATSCTQCSNSSYLLYLGYCITTCPSGFTANNGTCTSCPVNCKLCSSLTNCTTCVSSVYIIVNGTCTMNSTVNCSTGYFINSFGNCSQCYPTCQTCNGGSASNCLTCFSGSTLTNGVCQLNCADGTFFNANTSSCQQCSTQFSNCVSCSSTGCTLCSGNYTLVGSTCNLSCPSGTYLNNQQCYSCSSFCSICTSSNNCTQCVNSTFILYNGSCSSACPATTYLNGITCTPCFQTCLTCTTSSSTNCLSCITPYNFYLNNCLVNCPNGTYALNYTCQACSTNCLMCSQSGCTQCSSSYYLINGTCRSTCPSGYYVDSASSRCLACVQPCSQCNSRTNCTACTSPFNLSGNTCIGQCPAGQYFNTSLSACRNCSMTNCGYCNSTYCSGCLSSYYSFYSNGSISACISNCSNIQGTFNDNTNMNCSSCYSNCQTCTNSTYCTLCTSNYYLLQVAGVTVNECVTICPMGYYATLLRTCLPCATNCNVCVNLTYCTVCASNSYLFTSQTSNVTTISCITQCPTGYSTPAIIDGRGQCISCSSNCLACVDTNTCTQCVSSVYSLSNGQCIPYNCLNCQTCDTANNVCLNCTSPYFLSNKGCVAFCPNGQYGDNSTGQCAKCMANCLLCFNATSCTQCATSYVFVQASSSCENQGFVDFGTVGNMSGFTSNITQVMATVYVSTSAGPIAFGALSNTYGMMQVCQFMYFLQGSCGDNPQLSNFLNSLSMVSYSQNPNSQNSTNSTSSTSRLLTGIDYTSSFLQTNLPIFLMMIGFVSAYILVVMFSKYNESCCINYPTARKYISYICEFMQKRFKYIYVDCIMWISYLPFLYFSILQLQKLAFDSALNAISTILAFIIIIVYPLYPIFILRKLFDKSDKPEEHLKNYAVITLRLPLDEEEEAKRPICEGFTCCPKQNPDVSMVEMSLSPWIDSVVRPVYNEDVPEYREFKYFSVAHFRLAYAAIKYIRKFIFVLVAAVCPDPVATIATLIILSVIYMLYLIILKPKQKLYLILEIILQTLILFFLVFMLIYLKLGGATVTAMSVIAHAIGFALANSSLAIAIILNIMAYYTIICCLIDLVRHMRNKAEADDLKEKKEQFEAEIYPQVLNEKDDLPIDGYYGDDPQGVEHMDLEKDLIKKIQAEDKELDMKEKKKKGDDQLTEENNDDYQADHYDLDEKEFNVRSSMINKKKPEPKIEADEIPTLNHSQNRRKKKEVAKQPEPKYEGNTEDQIMMGRSKVSEDSNVDVNDGLLKQRENDKYRRKVGTNDLNVQKGILKQATDKFRRNPKQKNTEIEQESMNHLFTSPKIKPGRKEQQVQDINTHDRIKNSNDDKRIAEAEIISRKIKPKEKTRLNELDEVEMRERERLQKEKAKKAQEQIEIAKMRERERNKKMTQDPFGDFDQILDPKAKNNFEDLAIIERERKAKENSRNKEKQVSEFLPDQDGFNIVQRKPQPKKQKNEFYKGSDEEGELGEVKTKERQPNKFKRNVKNQEKPQQESYEALGKDIYTKKADKKQSAKEFAQDNTDELTYKEREGRGVNKKPTSIQQKQTYDLQQAKGLEREKKKAQKLNKPSSIYDNIQEPLAESITFAPEVRVKQQKSYNQPDFEEQNMQKQRKQRENAARRQKDNKLQIGSNLEESYDDVVNKNKQQIFKPDIAKTAKLLDIEGDGFEEDSYAPRPESKMERPKSRSKDMGLAANSKAQDSQDDSYDTRKQRNLASQRLRNKGNLQMNQELKAEQGGASRDSRRVSKLKEKKLKVKSGVLNIEDNSDNEDIEEFRFG